MIHNYSVHVLQGGCTSGANVCYVTRIYVVSAKYNNLCYNYCVYSMYLRSEAPVVGSIYFTILCFYKHNTLHAVLANDDISCRTSQSQPSHSECCTS